MIPVGIADAPARQLPVITFCVVAVSVLFSLAAWLLPDGRRAETLQQLTAYGAAHADQRTPEACVSLLPNRAQPANDDPDAATAVPVGPSAAFDRACFAVLDADRTSGALRWSVQPKGKDTPPLGWALHWLCWPNVIGALLGLLLLAVAGAALERQWGQPRYGGLVGGVALLTTLLWWQASTDASTPWSGGQALVAAVVGAFAIASVGLDVRYLVPTAERYLALPAWSLPAWWLIARIVAMAFDVVERPRLLSEVVGFLAGGGAALALHFQAERAAAGGPPTGHPVADYLPVVVVGWWAQLRQKATELVDGPPPDAPVEAALPPEVPAPDANWAVKSKAESDEAPVEPTPQWPQTERIAPAALTAVAPAVPAEPAPPAVPLPLPQPEPPAWQFDVDLPAELLPPAGSTIVDVDAAPDVSAMLFDFDAPELTDFAGQGRGFSSTLPMALPEAKAQNPVFSPPPAGLDDLAPPDDAAPPQAPDEQTRMVAPGEMPLGRAPRKFDPLAPTQEPTMAYTRGRPPSLGLSAFEAADPLRPLVRLARNVARAPDQTLLVEIDGQWESLAPDLVRAVAVGMVLHTNWPGATPEIWLDVIVDVGDRQHPAEAIRLHLGRTALQRLFPTLAPPQAFAALAEHLASAGGFPLPHQPVWPGPPWPRYNTAADFVRMWHRQLHG